MVLAWQKLFLTLFQDFSKSIHLQRHVIVIPQISNRLIKDFGEEEEEEKDEYFRVCHNQFTDLRI